jgi:hypothetical protein
MNEAESELICADEIPISPAAVADINRPALEEYFENRYRQLLENAIKSGGKL